MDFYELLTYLDCTFKEYPVKEPKKANVLLRNMIRLYPETRIPAYKMKKGLFYCAVDLILGGMNPKYYFADGIRKKFKLIVISHKGELLRYGIVYEDDPFFPYAECLPGGHNGQ